MYNINQKKKMKQLNFKISVIALAIGMFALTSCGGGGSKQNAAQQSDSEKTETAAPAKSASLKVKDTNTSNWQAVIKATREGIDIPLPDGWTVTKAGEGIARDVAVDFTVGGTTTAEQYGQMLFDITKAASQNGNHKVEITERGVAEGAVVGTLSESAIIAGETAYNWCFTEKSEYQYTRQIHYSFSKDGKQASLSF
jgi:ribosomal protein S19E (S16A)